MANQVVIIDYVNWRGERRMRTILPKELVFAKNQWHPQEQWLLHAFDVEQNTNKVFALKNIHSWQPALEKAI